jgi:hypothetical protein
MDDPDADLGRRKAEAGVAQALRELAANLIRIVRGAGNPDDLMRQALAFIQTVADHKERLGAYPAGHMIADALDIARDQALLARLDAGQVGRTEAEEHIIQGALQIAAARLLGQKAHESRAYNKMLDGVLEIVRLNREARAREKTAATARPPTWRKGA